MAKLAPEIAWRKGTWEEPETSRSAPAATVAFCRTALIVLGFELDVASGGI